MSGLENFDRQCRVSIGPSGKEGFQVGGTTANIPLPLHIAFSFQKADLESQNTGKVEIWNLSPAHLAVLEDKKCCLALKAGYGNRLSLIFSGVVSYFTTVLDGSDKKTEIEVNDSLIEIRNTYVSISYNGTVNWKTIFDDTASQMGVAVSYSYNSSFVDIPNGFSFVGLARDVISKGCNCCGLEWSIQNGVMQIKKPGDVMSKEAYVLSSKTGLIGVPAKVVVAKNEETDENIMGWEVEYLLNGAININDYVKLESKVHTGYLRVHSIDVIGDNMSGNWICKAHLMEVSN